jgi:hypothetical protein
MCGSPNRGPDQCHNGNSHQRRASPPKKVSAGRAVKRPITERRVTTTIMAAMIGTATMPLSTALQTSIWMGSIGAYLKQHWPAIREQLLNGTYEPKPVRRVEIPKPDGGMRKLGIPMHHA